MNAFTQALDAILAANLPTATEVVAIRLLAEASKANGQYNCTWDDYLTLCNCANRGAAQRHLTRLSKVKIIHYSTNDRVYIAFWAWLGDDDRAKSARGRAETVHPTRQIGADEVRIANDDAPNQRVDAPNQRATYTRARAPGWVELSNDLDQDLNDSILNSTQPLTPSQEWTAQLLTDHAVDLQPDNAMQIALLHKPAYVVKHVATWWPKRKEESPGVLVYRLLKSRRQCRPNPHPSEEFLESEFWRTHYALAPDELAMELPSPPRPDRDNEIELDDVVLVYTGKNRR